MATKKQIESIPEVDEFARSIFELLGYPHDTPDHVAIAYHRFKKLKDKMQPGRLSPDGFAMVVCLAEMNPPEYAKARGRGRRKKADVESEELPKSDDGKGETEPAGSATTSAETTTESPFE